MSTSTNPSTDAAREPHRSRRWAAWVVGPVVILAGVAIAVSGVLGSDPEASPAAQSPSPSPTESSTESASASPSPTALVDDPFAGRPTRLLVPELGIDAPVTRIKVRDGILFPPDDPQVLGWWRDGAEPGAGEGSALVTGHTVHTGGGALDDLERLQPGDVVRVRTQLGTLEYAVSSTRIYRKARLAADAQELFRQDGPGRLVLVTCEDWDGEKYLSNVVVIAQPVAQPVAQHLVEPTAD